MSSFLIFKNDVNLNDDLFKSDVSYIKIKYITLVMDNFYLSITEILE